MSSASPGRWRLAAAIFFNSSRSLSLATCSACLPMRTRVDRNVSALRKAGHQFEAAVVHQVDHPGKFRTWARDDEVEIPGDASRAKDDQRHPANEHRREPESGEHHREGGADLAGRADHHRLSRWGSVICRHAGTLCGRRHLRAFWPTPA